MGILFADMYTVETRRCVTAVPKKHRFNRTTLDWCRILPPHVQGNTNREAYAKPRNSWAAAIFSNVQQLNSVRSGIDKLLCI